MIWRRLAFLALMMLALIGSWLLLSSDTTASFVAPSPMSEPTLGGEGPLKVESVPGIPTPADIGAFSELQARLYAALGEVADGRREQMPHVKADENTVVEMMRRLLAAHPPQRGEAKPTVQQNVTSMIVSGAILPPAGSQGLEIAPLSVLSGEPPTVADSIRHLGTSRTTGSVTRGPDGHTITGREVWAAIKAKPGLGLPVRIVDRGEGGHVIAVFADDFGTVRVNGGLVVPGRYYLIKGSIDVSAMVPVGIHIRPLSAVPSYHDQPLMAPSANG